MLIDTHCHVDHIPGNPIMAEKYNLGLEIHALEENVLAQAPNYGPMFGIEIPSQPAVARFLKDGDVEAFGDNEFHVLHTPGHTLESACYLLKDENDKPHALFTGDTLFVGDVGRPDLSSGNMSSEELAGIMYDTIQNKILPLADDVIVYPAHGAGSSCGKNLSPNTFSTIGEEKQTNYALQPQTKEEFIKVVTDGLTEAPKYFAINAKINMQGYDSIEEVKQKGVTPLSINAFKKLIAEDVLILDTRHADKFTEGFIPGSIFIGLEGRFAEWAGALLPFDKPMILVTEPGMEEETVIRLSRVGFDKMLGFLQGSFEAWSSAGEKVDMIINIEADELAMDIPHDPNLVVVDVRRETEFADGHVAGAQNLPLNEMNDVVMMMNDDLTRMVLNPDVVTRSRGVIEKCSFCVQRIQEGKLTAKKEGRPLKDGDVKSACQTACPTNAITFGDQNNKESVVAKTFDTSGRNYYVLEEQHFLSAVGYQVKVRNKDEEPAQYFIDKPSEV